MYLKIIFKCIFRSSMNKLENQTLASLTDSADGRKWWANFEFYPEAVGERKAAFRGYMYSGDNYFTQTDCVVKFSDPAVTEEDLVRHVEGITEVRRLAELFNATQNCVKVIVLLPCVAVMDKVAPFYNRVFRFLHKNYSRVIADDDCVLLEERVPEQFTSFVDPDGHSSDVCPQSLHQFAHFCFNETKGQLAVTNIQGIMKDNKLVLSSPVVHSVTQKYGPRDRGMQGIANFFKNFSKTCCENCKKNLSFVNASYPSAPPIVSNNTDHMTTEKTAADFMLMFEDSSKPVVPPSYSDIGCKESPPPPYDSTCFSALPNNQGLHLFGSKNSYINNKIQTV